MLRYTVALLSFLALTSSTANAACESSMTSRITLFSDDQVIVNFDRLLPRLKPGTEIVFGQGRNFRIDRLLFVSKFFYAFVVDQKQILLLPNYEGLSAESQRQNSLYYFATRRIREMHDHLPDIEKSQIPHLEVDHFDELFQYVLFKPLPSDAVSLRNLVENPDQLTKAHFDALGLFAETSALYESFGAADILDQIYFSPTQGALLLYWSDVKKVNPKKIIKFPVGSVFHQGMQRVAIASRLEALQLNRRHAYSNGWKTSFPNAKIAQLFHYLTERTRNRRAAQLQLPQEDVIVSDVEDTLETNSVVRKVDLDAVAEAFDEWAYSRSPQIDDDLRLIVRSDSGALYFPEKFAYVSSFHASQAFLVSQVWQFRVFDELPIAFFPPNHETYSDRYYSSAETYWRNYQRIEKADIPILPATKHRYGIIEPSFKIPFFTAADLLFRLGSLDDPLFAQLLEFAGRTAPIVAMDDLRLVDIVYVPGRGWHLRHADGKIAWYQQGSTSDQNTPCLFSDALLDEVTLNEDDTDFDVPDLDFLQKAMHRLRSRVLAERLGLL